MKRGPSRPGPYDRLDGRLTVTTEQLSFMHRRVGALLQMGGEHRPLIDLLANAYLLGLDDMVALKGDAG